MKYLVFLILICMLFFIKNAATSLLIYGFFAADRDGYSFLEFFSTLYPNFKLYSRSLFFVLFVYSIIYLFLKIRKLTKEEFVKIFLALIISFLIVFNSLLKDNDIIWALSVLVFNGIPVYVIWYIMGLRYNNDYKFLGYISLKTILATAVLLIPLLAFLDGSLYKATEGLFVNEVSDVNLSLPTGDSIKGAYSRYSIYHNPNSLGFHSVIGILIGIYFLVFKKRILKIFGLFLIGCGCIGWLNSLTRGPMIFLILGFCYIALLNIFYGKRQNFEIKILLLLSLLGVGLAIFLLSDISKYLIPDSNDNSVVDRLEGYLYSFDVIKTHFLLGVGKNWDWGQFYPHFMPLSLTADHGIIVGVLESISIFMGGIYTIIKASRNYLTISSNRENSLLSIMLVFIVIGIAVTNNFTAPVIFWIMLAQADLLNKRVING